MGSSKWPTLVTLDQSPVTVRVDRRFPNPNGLSEVHQTLPTENRLNDGD